MKKTKIFSLLFILVLGLVFVSCGKKQLSTPSDLTYTAETRTISWSEVKNASSYHVRINSGEAIILEEDVEVNSYSVYTLGTGAYTVFVYAKDPSYTDSDTAFYNFDHYRPTSELPVLATPTNLVKNGNVLTWNTVANATAGYLVIVSRGSSEADVVTVSVPTYTFTLTQPGHYTIHVYAKEVTNEYQRSLPAENIFNVEQVLGTPAITVSETGLITWATVSNADGYNVKITYESVEITNYTTISHEYQISNGSNNIKRGEYQVSVTAVNSSEAYYLDSVPATTTYISYERVLAPGNLEFNQATDVISWGDVSDNDGYYVEVKNSDDEVVLVLDGIIVANFSTKPLGSGDYRAYITTYAKENTYFQDSYSNYIDFTILSLGALNNPSNLAIQSGYLTWTNVPNSNTVIQLFDLESDTEILDITPRYYNSNHLFLNDLGIESGDYRLVIKFTSNRHDNPESNPVDFKFTYQLVQYYSASDIATFTGVDPRGEHSFVELITGTPDYAVVGPTVDGWGRLGSPDIPNVNFSKTPIVLLQVGPVIGGYHLQVGYNGGFVGVLGDVLVQGGRNVNLTASSDTFVGTGTIYLRLGVNSSSGGTNDARVSYEYVTVSYVYEYQEPITENEKLDDVTNLRVNLQGNIAWNVVNNATDYIVTVTKDKTEEEVYSGSLVNPYYDPKFLSDGIYVLSVIAHSTEELLEDSETPSTYTFKLQTVVNYDYISTGEGGNFTPENGLQAAYNEETHLSTINSGDSTSYGWVRAKDGVTLNMDLNPIILFSINSAYGGYFFKSLYTGRDDITMINDTRVGDGITDPFVIQLRANVNVDRQSVNTKDFSGIVEGYKVRPGVMGNGDTNKPYPSTILVEYLKIVYVTLYEEIEVGEVVQLETPTFNELKPEGIVIFNGVSGNSEYTPAYQVTIYDTTLESILTTFTQVGLEVNLINYSLVNGHDYEIIFKALGDKLGESEVPLYFTDSEEVSAKVHYVELLKIDDFTGLVPARRDGDENFTVDFEVGTTLTYSTTTDQWGFFAFAYETSITISANTTYIVKLGNVVNAPTINIHFYDAVGTGKHTIKGDTSVSSNEVIVLRNAEHLNPATIQEGYIYFGFGYGGGAVNRSIEIVELILVEFTLIS